ncbi:YbdD/YjiX family protein [Paeniglutamicibacter gangotriensis]|uniref:YbdD/YjiX family protein n=1 Tax=Paeniglutamicibacter gangotriensis TaxID=254787 RepID=UPI0037C8A1DE
MEAASTSTTLRALRSVGSGARALTRYLEGVLGADKYRIYLEHQARTHPGEAPMGEREFWRDYTDWQEKNPQGRCC